MHPDNAIANMAKYKKKCIQKRIQLGHKQGKQYTLNSEDKAILTDISLVIVLRSSEVHGKKTKCRSTIRFKG